MHGAAAVTASVFSALSLMSDFVEIDTSPGDRLGGRYHLHRLRRHAAAVRAIVRYARRRPHGLYAGCPAGLALWYLVGIAAAARLCGYHVVLHHHSFAYLSRQSAPMKLLVLLGGSCTTHVVLCHRMASEFAQRYRPSGNIVVCSNAAWMRPFDGPLVPVASKRFRLGHLGRLTDEKGLGHVLRTLQGLVERGVDAELHLAGPLGGDADRRLLEEVRPNLDGRLKMLGPVTGADKASFYSSIDAFIFPSRWLHEAEPLVVLEALAAGVTVVAYGRGCIACLVLGRAGLVVDSERDFVAVAVPYLSELARSPVALDAARNAATQAFDHGRAQATEGRRATLDAIVGLSRNVAGPGNR